MKRMIFLLALLPAVALVRAQTFQLPSDPVTHEVTYTEEVGVPGKTAREVYDKAKPFVFSDLQNVKYIRFWGDENTSRIFVHGGLPYDYGNPPDYSMTSYVYFELTVECHDGGYKYTFAKFSYDQMGTDIWTTDAETSGAGKKQKRGSRRERKIRALIDKFVRKNIEMMKEGI